MTPYKQHQSLQQECYRLTLGQNVLEHFLHITKQENIEVDRGKFILRITHSICYDLTFKFVNLRNMFEDAFLGEES